MCAHRIVQATRRLNNTARQLFEQQTPKNLERCTSSQQIIFPPQLTAEASTSPTVQAACYRPRTGLPSTGSYACSRTSHRSRSVCSCTNWGPCSPTCSKYPRPSTTSRRSSSTFQKGSGRGLVRGPVQGSGRAPGRRHPAWSSPCAGCSHCCPRTWS